MGQAVLLTSLRVVSEFQEGQGTLADGKTQPVGIACGVITGGAAIEHRGLEGPLRHRPQHQLHGRNRIGIGRPRAGEIGGPTAEPAPTAVDEEIRGTQDIVVEVAFDLSHLERQPAVEPLLLQPQLGELGDGGAVLDVGRGEITSQATGGGDALPLNDVSRDIEAGAWPTHQPRQIDVEIREQQAVEITPLLIPPGIDHEIGKLRDLKGDAGLPEPLADALPVTGQGCRLGGILGGRVIGMRRKGSGPHQDEGQPEPLYRLTKGTHYHRPPFATALLAKFPFSSLVNRKLPPKTAKRIPPAPARTRSCMVREARTEVGGQGVEDAEGCDGPEQRDKFRQFHPARPRREAMTRPEAIMPPKALVGRAETSDATRVSPEGA